MHVRLLWAAAIAVATVSIHPVSAKADSLPSMNHSQPVKCLRDTNGLSWRVQCDASTKMCLYAPDSELSSQGIRTRGLQRARSCTVFNDKFDQDKLRSEGYQLLRGLVDTPYGWTRDERGRVFQTNFDLKRRLYFGAKYNPYKLLGEERELKRSAFDFGLLILQHHQGRNTHRLRLIEGEVRVEPFSSELVLLHYELSRRFLDPLLRITTFAGTPQRHDLHLDLGLWTEAGRVEVHHTNHGNSTLWQFGTGQLTIDLWQSSRLDSFLRLRTGVGFERLYTDKTGNRTALTGISALELDWVLDREGFHNLRGELTWEVPRYFAASSRDKRLARRHRAKIEYEAIILAVNDQPLSLTAGIGGERRNDLPVVNDRWAFVADAGLRVSLWAPPKRR